jgi:hypothetical protein
VDCGSLVVIVWLFGLPRVSHRWLRARIDALGTPRVSWGEVVLGTGTGGTDTGLVRHLIDAVRAQAGGPFWLLRNRFSGRVTQLVGVRVADRGRRGCGTSIRCPDRHGVGTRLPYGHGPGSLQRGRTDSSAS